MSIFDQHLSNRNKLAATLAESALESNTTLLDTTTTVDPLAGADDAFAEQRAAMNRTLGLESLVTAELLQVEATQEVDQTASTQVDATQEVTQTAEQTDQSQIDATQEAVQSAATAAAPEQSAETQEVTQEVTQVNEPVDGADDDLTVGTTDTDVDLPKGNFTAELGDDDDVVIDADDLDDEADEADYLDNQMRMLMDSAMAIESYGINPTAMAIMQTTGLLNSTALESLGLEAFGFQPGSHPESQLAMEALTDKLKETATKWSAKVMNVVSSSSEKVMSVLTPLWDKVTGLVKTISNRTWDATKVASATVKAHPYKTIIAVIGAIATVAGIVALCVTGAPAPGAKIDAMKSFIGRIVGDINKIKWPFGTVKATAGESGQKLLVEFSRGSAVVEAGKLSEKGWTATAVKAMASQLNRAYEGVKHAWGAFGTRASKLAASAGSAALDFGVKPGLNAGTIAGRTVSEGLTKRGTGKFTSYLAGSIVADTVARTYMAGFVALILGLFKLTVNIVVGGIRLIKSTLSAILPHSEPATA